MRHMLFLPLALAAGATTAAPARQQSVSLGRQVVVGPLRVTPLGLTGLLVLQIGFADGRGVIDLLTAEGPGVTVTTTLGGGIGAAAFSVLGLAGWCRRGQQRERCEAGRRAHHAFTVDAV